jgi:hypothetical protein
VFGDVCGSRNVKRNLPGSRLCLDAVVCADARETPARDDQHFNAARVEELGAGLVLDAKPGHVLIADGITRLLVEPSF